MERYAVIRGYSDGEWLVIDRAGKAIDAAKPTFEEAMRAATARSLAEGQRAWDAASPYEREAMSDTSGT